MKPSTRPEDIREILEQIESGHALLFLGAGSTQNCRRSDGKAGLTGRDLAREILQELNHGQAPGFEASLTRAAEFYTGVKASARRGLDRFLCDRLQGLRPTVGHHIAASLPWRAVVTTNYNRVVEDAWAEAADAGYATRPLRVIRTDDELLDAGADPESTPLYKPHGCISLPGQGSHRMVVTSADYFESERLRHGMFEQLRTLARECTTLFIGYSLEDFTFRNIFYTLHAEEGDWTSRAYSVGPIDHPLRLQWLSRAMDRSYNTTVLDDTFDALLVRLAAARGSIDDALRQVIRERWDTARTDDPEYMDEALLSRIEGLPARPG